MLTSLAEYLKYQNLDKSRKKLNSYLANFAKDNIDTSKVGKKISQGLQHFVYEYGDREVIKVPRFDLFNLLYGVLNPKDVQLDNNLIESHFKKYAVKTRIFSSKDKELYCIVQEKVRNRININSQNIHLVIKQFNEIYSKNKILEDLTGYSLDLWGKSGILKSIGKSINKSNIFIEMTNLMIEKDELSNYRIKIIDTNLFKIKLNITYLFRIFTDRIIYYFSDYVLKRAKFLS